MPGATQVITKIIEVCHVDADGKQTGNWGKFMVGKFVQEWAHESQVYLGHTVMMARGWSKDHLLVLDLETGEGAIFKPGGFAKADLDKRKIWVCPMFEPFLTWLYKQDRSDLSKLPSLVTFKVGEVEFAMHGYRRTGK